jgi:hypothetical protein
MPKGIERREYERISCETPILHNTSPVFFTKALCTTSVKKDCISNLMKTYYKGMKYPYQ